MSGDLNNVSYGEQSIPNYVTATQDINLDLITVTQPINLDNVTTTSDISKLGYIAVTANVDLDDLKSTVDTLSGGGDSAKLAYIAVTQAVDLDALENTVNVTHEGEITTLQSDLTILSGTVSTNQTNISTNASDIASVESDITSLQSDVSAAQSDIGDIETKTNYITVTQAVNLDTIESNTATALSYSTASKAVTELITVTENIDLDDVALSADISKLDLITVTSPIDLDDAVLTADIAKLDYIAVTQAVNLDTIESDVASLKTKTNYITVTQAVDLDTIETDVAASKTKTQHITVSQAVDLDSIESTQAALVTKTNHITVTQAVDLDTMESSIAAATVDITDLQTLTGVADGSSDLDTFTGVTIPDNPTVKSALQSLETALEVTDTLTDAATADIADLRTLTGTSDGETNLATFTGTTIQDNRNVKQAFQDVETVLDTAKAKTNNLTVTASTNLDTIRTKSNYLTITENVDLDNLSGSKWWWDAEEDLGIVPNDEASAAANTTALQAYFTANASTRMPPLAFHQADYWFSGQLHDGNDAGYRSFFMFGAGGPEFAAQHMEDAAAIKRYTRFMIKNLADKSTPWLKIDGSSSVSLQPRGLKFKDIAFFIPTGHTGTIFDFGNYSIAGDSDSSTIRSISVDNCYFSEQDHVANDALSTAWLTYEGATDGHVLNRTQGDYLVRMSRCYDISLKAGFRGSNGPQLWLANCDAPKIYSRHLLAWQAVRLAVTDDDHFNNDEGVPGMIQTYCETPMISAIFATAGSIDCRVESGYSEALTVAPIGTEDANGLYDLPDAVTWFAGIDSRYIQFSNMPSGRTVLDYFEPGMYIKLTPAAGGTFDAGTVNSTSNFVITGGSSHDGAYVGRSITRASSTSFSATNTEHARIIQTYDGTTKVATVSPAFSSLVETNKLRIADDHEYNLIVSEVDSSTNRVYFAQNTGTCKIKRAIAGDGDDCLRVFGSCAVVTGERVEIQSASISPNEHYPDTAAIVAAPSKKNIIIRNSYCGSGEAPSDLTQYFQMCSHCRPGQYVAGHVQYQGYQYWDHPYVKNVAGVPFDPNVSEYVEHDYSKAYPFFWKAGVHEDAEGNSQALMLTQIADGDRMAWVYYLGTASWWLPMKNPVNGVFNARVWSPQAYTSTFRFRGEVSDNIADGWDATHDVNVAAGWQILEWTTTLTSPTRFRLSQRDLYVEWVGMTPS